MYPLVNRYLYISPKELGVNKVVPLLVLVVAVVVLRPTMGCISFAIYQLVRVHDTRVLVLVLVLVLDALVLE
jgi:hypothetical protein